MYQVQVLLLRTRCLTKIVEKLRKKKRKACQDLNPRLRFSEGIQYTFERPVSLHEKKYHRVMPIYTYEYTRGKF